MLHLRHLIFALAAIAAVPGSGAVAGATDDGPGAQPPHASPPSIANPAAPATTLDKSAPQAPPAGAGRPTQPPGGMPDVVAPVPHEDRLTLRQAVQIGLRDNPQTIASHYQVVSAHENYNSQRSPINPTVQYAALNNTVAPIGIGNGFAQAQNYSAYVTLETNGAMKYRARQGRGQYQQAEFDAATAAQTLKLDIIDAYVNLQVADRALVVERQVYTNVSELSDLTQKRFQLGAGPEADAIRARIAMVQEEQNVIADAANVDSARAAINAALGHSPDALVDAASPLVYRPVDVPAVELLTTAAERNRPEIKSEAANLQALRAVPGLQRSAYYPDVILGRDFASDGELSLGLAVPIDLGSIKGAVRRANADVRAQEAQITLSRQAVDLDVKTSCISLSAARRQVDSYESGILTQSETLLARERQGYTLGAATILDVITAENTLRSVQSAYYTAVGAYEQALYALDHAIGAPAEATPGATIESIGTGSGK